ncbi:MAG: hypothetical protein P8O20_02895 [Bacteroidia bacterium]|nr:hypothetical protein [Bacteroidia bacterium]
MSLFRKILSKMHDKYRLVIINDSSLGESFSFRLTPLNMIMLLATLTMVIFGIFFLLIRFTPTSTLIGGNSGSSIEYMKLNQKIEDLTTEMEARQIKQDALIKILSENEMSLDSSQAVYKTLNSSTKKKTK